LQDFSTDADALTYCPDMASNIPEVTIPFLMRFGFLAQMRNSLGIVEQFMNLAWTVNLTP
jgi:hypothetical protein